MIVQFEFRRATAEEWAIDNPVLAAGEPGIDADSNALKVGDGFTAWNDLQFLSGLGSGGSPIGLTWADITGKPTLFPPTGHQHPASDIVNLTEVLQDGIAASLSAGDGIATSYDDVSGILTISATAPSGGVMDPEAVRDIIDAYLQGSGLITVTVDDVANTATISTSATQNSSDAFLRNRANHTGTNPISATSGLQTALDDRVLATALATELRKTEALAFYAGSSYPTRTTVTSDTSRRVKWVGPVAPSIGGAYAITLLDVWEKTA